MHTRILNLFTDMDTRSGSTKLTITGRIHSLSNWENVQTLRVFSIFWRIFLIYNQELLFCLSSRNMVMISIQKCFSVLFVFLPMVGMNVSPFFEYSTRFKCRINSSMTRKKMLPQSEILWPNGQSCHSDETCIYMHVICISKISPF